MAVSSEARTGISPFAFVLFAALCDTQVSFNCGPTPYLAREHQSPWFLIYTPPPLGKTCGPDISVTASLTFVANIESL